MGFSQWWNREEILSEQGWVLTDEFHQLDTLNLDFMEYLICRTDRNDMQNPVLGFKTW